MKGLIGRVTVTTILLLAMGGAVSVGVLMTAVDFVTPPSYSGSMATVQNVSSEAWTVFDVNTGEVLYSYNDDEPLPIASVTKLPVARLLNQSSRIWATTTVTWGDVSAEGRAGRLSYGDEYQLHTLLFPLLLESSNDASAVFEREFKALVPGLNRYVSLLGLVHTHFTDASGLSPENISTTRELAMLFREIYYSSRHVVDITTLSQYVAPNNGWLNNNHFSHDERYLGGKQGYTPEAGKTVVAAFKEPLSNGSEREIGYVLLGSDNLEYDIGLLRHHVQNNVSYR